MPQLFTADDVREWLAEEVREAGSQKAWAEQNLVSAAYVNDVLRGRREPGETIAAALGFRCVVLFEAAPKPEGG